VINNIVFSGLHIPTNQWFPPDDPYYASNRPIVKRDVERARKLLADAGVPRPKLELMVNPPPEYRHMAEILQSMTAETGFELRVRVTETATAYQATRNGDFDAFLTAYLGRGDPETQIVPQLACSGPYNEGRYCDARLDQIFLQASRRFPPEERRALYQEAAAIILHDHPNVYLLNRRFLYGYTAKLSGFRPIPAGFIHLQGVNLK
jgi:peptide/nickel transport system substrate-binding protein